MPFRLLEVFVGSSFGIIILWAGYIAKRESWLGSSMVLKLAVACLEDYLFNWFDFYWQWATTLLSLPDLPPSCLYSGFESVYLLEWRNWFFTSEKVCAVVIPYFYTEEVVTPFFETGGPWLEPRSVVTCPADLRSLEIVIYFFSLVLLSSFKVSSPISLSSTSPKSNLPPPFAFLSTFEYLRFAFPLFLAELHWNLLRKIFLVDVTCPKWVPVFGMLFGFKDFLSIFFSVLGARFSSPGRKLLESSDF